jgi:hypothetical protein
MRDPPAARRACADATSPARRAAPADTPPHRKTRARPGGPAACRPTRRLPRGRPVGPDARPLAEQPVLIEPVPHRGRLHAKLAGDAGAWPSPRQGPVGQVVLERGEAQLRRPCSEVLVGAAAATAGRGHLAGRGSEAGGVQQAADHRGGGAKLAGQLRGAGLLLAACSEVAVKVAVPLRMSVAVEAALLAVEDVKPPLRVSVRGVGAAGGVIHAPGVPGAPPLRETLIDEVTCADGSISGAVRATRMGNAGSAPAGSCGLRTAGSGCTARMARSGHNRQSS